jgi:hypothetical protein
MFKNYLVIGFVALLLGACAGRPPPVPLSQEEWAAAQTRTFKDLARDRFVEAAKEVFELSDRGAFNYFGERDGDFRARRVTNIILSGQTGFQPWLIRIDQVGNDLKAHASVQSTLTGNTYRSHIGQAGSVAAYRMLWERIEFVLGRRNVWPTCDQMKKNYEGSQNSNVTWLFVWCTVFHKDETPKPAKKP